MSSEIEDLRETVEILSDDETMAAIKEAQEESRREFTSGERLIVQLAIAAVLDMAEQGQGLLSSRNIRDLKSAHEKLER